ncbi:UNKNOWN [Stylonychia lemnae]|uniref:Uncharacterized protein n=1 Tax=Stylonychia lemnae TaxID=5949 RepID=A0A078ALF6_STYLE|nr:UNKNOWN [Stylonychia lemnae]|eukprot:CDW83049.1 UNKNOWN [Stylonychia lemnae]
MVQGLKNKKGSGKPGHTQRKARPTQQHGNTFKKKNNIKITQEINKNIEELIRERARQGQMNLKILKDNREYKTKPIKK